MHFLHILVTFIKYTYVSIVSNYYFVSHQSVSKLVKPGFNVLIEKGAGSSSHFSDAEYASAGAKIVEADEVWKNSDIVMKVWSNHSWCYLDDFATIQSLKSHIHIDVQQTLFPHFSYVLQRRKKPVNLKIVLSFRSSILLRTRSLCNNFKIKRPLHLPWIVFPGH